MCSQILAFLAAVRYTRLNSCKYLKNETHLQNAQINKVSSVNKGVIKTCLIVDMVKKNWLWIVVARCGWHYFVLACFGSFGVVANFSTAERFKYISVFHSYENSYKIKKQNNFIFSSLVTWTCQMCFTPTVGYGIIVHAPLFTFY